MKERGCADRCPQQEYITKEESSSPIVSLCALIGLCVIDAMEERKMITVDISGAFLQDNWPQDEHPGYIMFKGIMVSMICTIDPSNQDKVIWSNDGKRNSYTTGSSKQYMRLTQKTTFANLRFEKS